LAAKNATKKGIFLGQQAVLFTTPAIFAKGMGVMQSFRKIFDN
jgi:hypothetical protein